MHGKTSLAALAALVACLSCAGTSPQPSPTPAGEAVVLVTVDGLVAEELSLFGGARAVPALERLAAGGAAWDDAWTASPLTRPAAATYLTGVGPDRHGVRDDVFTALDESLPTLAMRLGESGFRTGAFPDSSFLGRSSGLLRGFEAIADPPAIPISPARWLPHNRAAADVAADFVTWLETLPEGTRYFAWLHFSQPLNQRLREAAAEFAPLLAPQVRREAQEDSVARFDEALRQVLDGLDARGDRPRALIVVAGTQGDPSGDEIEPPGPGFSLAPRAVRVPVVVGWPAGAGSAPRREGTVWAPDVHATIVQATGLDPSPSSDGVSLLAEVAPDRLVYAWSSAPLEHLGWSASRTARSGRFRLVAGPRPYLEDMEDAEATVPPQVEQRLREGLAARPIPPPREVDVDVVRPLLASHGVELQPLDPRGRTPADSVDGRELGGRMWAARLLFQRGQGDASLRHYRRVLEADPHCPGALLDLGQLLVVSGEDPAEGRRHLETAAARYPQRPEVLHWYAHALWAESWEEAEQLLEAILPFKQREGDVLYDLACTRSLAGDVEASERYLRRAIEAGFEKWRHMETNPNLRTLRESGRLSAVLQEHGR